uniref:Catalase n=1 Tax=Scedosporium boydii TaxID=5597 RepID=A0A0K1U4S4_SCEBO|nr:catalase A1 [Scedosporium boydii]
MKNPFQTNLPFLALLNLSTMASLVSGQCPFANRLKTRQEQGSGGDSRSFIQHNDVEDGDVYMTSDVGGPIADQRSLRAGDRGPTLLEDFIFRQKITRFDHERVPERVVHARGAGAYGKFVSYGDYSNITAASFLSSEGKETPVFVRFSTVLGSRGSPDTVRDVHGFATRFYTDEGNWDLVGNNIPVFFIQDAIQFPDVIHAGKPKPDSEIPQAGTAHDSAWDFFSMQSTALHTLFFAMSGFGIPRSYRHMDGFGVNTYRFVNDRGESKLVKFHWKTLQGKASLVWEEAQVTAGTNIDFHRDDLWQAIESGHAPEWEFAVQLVDEDQAQAHGFDVLDPTKIIPEEIAPLQKLGKLTLDTNPRNYFAETEQIMFQPGHIVRGIDFSEDPLLQGRIFSYLDTQLSRHGGPNFEQIPINRPITDVHNNNRDGAAQMMIHGNTIHYSPNSLHDNLPNQANETDGRGFFTAPQRRIQGDYVRALPSSFDDHWSQPRLFYNSLTPAEQQQVVDAIRFETSQVKSDTVKNNVITQLNKISNDIAARVATALGLPVPDPDPTYYHDNTTAGFSVLKDPLPTIAGLRVGVLATVNDSDSLSQARDLKSKFDQEGVSTIVVAERYADGVDAIYSGIRANAFDGLVITKGTEALFGANATNPLYPRGRPTQTLEDSYNWGKPVAAVGSGSRAFDGSVVQKGPGVYTHNDTSSVVDSFKDGLRTFKFVDRFPTDNPSQ